MDNFKNMNLLIHLELTIINQIKINNISMKNNYFYKQTTKVSRVACFYIFMNLVIA